MNKCNGKICYSSRARARKAIIGREFRGAAHLRAYQCNVCYYWHLTSVPRKT